MYLKCYFMQMVRPDPVASGLSAMFFPQGITLLECFCFSRCLTRRYRRMYQVLRPPPLILSSLTNLSRWNYISNGKKERYSSTLSGDAKIGFAEFNIAFNIPKVVSFKGCYQLSTLPSVTMRKVTCLVLYDLDMFLLQLLGEMVLKFQLNNCLCFLS